MKTQIDSQELDMIIDAVKHAAEDPDTVATGCCAHGDAEVAFQFRKIDRPKARELLYRLRGLATATRVTLEGD